MSASHSLTHLSPAKYQSESVSTVSSSQTFLTVWNPSTLSISSPSTHSSHLVLPHHTHVYPLLLHYPPPPHIPPPPPPPPPRSQSSSDAVRLSADMTILLVNKYSNRGICGVNWFDMVNYCIVLYCTVLYCTVLCCTVLYCIVLYYTVL